MRWPRFTAMEAAIVIVCLILLVVMTIHAFGHDSWIAGKKNASGELCCGENDCVALNHREVVRRGVFYFLFQGDEFRPEVIHESEALISPDGHYWRCHKPDGSRRCFFAPPPNS